MRDKFVQIKARLPARLAEWLKAEAVENRRTQTAELAHLVEQAKRSKSAA